MSEAAIPDVVDYDPLGRHEALRRNEHVFASQVQGLFHLDQMRLRLPHGILGSCGVSCDNLSSVCRRCLSSRLSPSAIAVLHNILDRLSPRRSNVTRGTYGDAYGLLQCRRRPNVEIRRCCSPPAYGAMRQPHRERIIHGDQPVQRAHVGTYGATSTVACTV